VLRFFSFTYVLTWLCWLAASLLITLLYFALISLGAVYFLIRMPQWDKRNGMG